MNKQEKHHAKYKRGICWGTWDGLHVGHFNILSRAKKLCDELYVGISNDEYVYYHKGHYPMFTRKDRGYHLGLYANKYIKKTFTQRLEVSKKETVDKYKPDVIFVGDDWLGKDWDRAKLGIPVIYLPRTQNISSTKLRKLIK